MAPPEQPKLRLKDRRRRLMWVKVAAGTSVVLVSLAVIFYASRLPSFTISQIQVNGTNLVNADDVRALAEAKLSGTYALLVPRRNAFFAPIGSIKNAIIATFPPAGKVTVSRRDVGTLDIIITERQAAALWCAGTPPASKTAAEECYSMDAGGFIFAKTADTGVLVHYYGGVAGNPVGTKFLGGAFATLDATVKGIADSIHRTPQTVSIQNDTDVALDFAEGGELRFIRQSDKQSVIQNVASVFASQSFKDHPDFEYVDFRFGDKVYVKFK